MKTIEPIIAAAQAAGAEGIWLLNGATPRMEYTAPPAEQDQAERSAVVGMSEFEALMQDGDIPRVLDLQDAGRVLIICLPGPDDGHEYGLVTLLPMPGYCRVCGCSQLNPCETDEGPCGWAESDLCSACVDWPAPSFGDGWPLIRERVLARLAETSPDHPWLKGEALDAD